MNELQDPQEIKKLIEKMGETVLPPELRGRIELQLESLSRSLALANFSQDLENIRRYLEWVLSLPWNRFSEDNLDLKEASATLNRNHYGMALIKERVLEYISVLKLNQGKLSRSGSVLCFTGLPGLGKTSLASSIAQSLNRKFVRVPFGGLGEVSQIRGLPRFLPSSEPGQIIKGLRRATSLNPVILLDEIDRVAETTRGVIMGALLELLDPEQNGQFVDYYIDYPFDLGQVLFIVTANNTRSIANAVLDRLEVIEMPSYTDEEKIAIGKNYLLPKVLTATGLKANQVSLDDNLWPKIIRPLGYDAGIRTLERTINGICRKVARRLVEGQGPEFVISQDNIKDFLPS